MQELVVENNRGNGGCQTGSGGQQGFGDATYGYYARPLTAFYAQDSWKMMSNFTLNYGLGWNAQTGFYNSDLAKPQYLAPIYGAHNLAPTANNLHQMEPVVGFAWSPFKNNKTVIRGGGGIYWDSTPGYYKLREPAVVGPLGDGRLTLSPSDFQNTFAMIECAAHRAVDLGHAAEAIRVLHPRIIREMRLADFAVPQELAQMLGDRNLSWMRARPLDARIESGRRSLQGLEAHGSGDVRHARQAPRAK